MVNETLGLYCFGPDLCDFYCSKSGWSPSGSWKVSLRRARRLCLKPCLSEISSEFWWWRRVGCGEPESEMGESGGEVGDPCHGVWTLEWLQEDKDYPGQPVPIQALWYKGGEDDSCAGSEVWHYQQPLGTVSTFHLVCLLSFYRLRTFSWVCIQEQDHEEAQSVPVLQRSVGCTGLLSISRSCRGAAQRDGSASLSSNQSHVSCWKLSAKV